MKKLSKDGLEQELNYAFYDSIELQKQNRILTKFQTKRKQAYEQIKSMVQNSRGKGEDLKIVELGEAEVEYFVVNVLSEFQELIENGWAWDDDAVKNRFKLRLKEYDKLRRGK